MNRIRVAVQRVVEDGGGPSEDGRVFGGVQYGRVDVPSGGRRECPDAAREPAWPVGIDDAAKAYLGPLRRCPGQGR